MALSIIPEDRIVSEEAIQKEINSSISENRKIVFNSGAGAGKTYALIESLKYILRQYGSRLKKNNQAVICITYTNVATNEVKERLGETEIILVSTIHERMWDLIKRYQKELVAIHREKLNKEIVSIEEDLKSNEKFQFYSSLPTDLKEEFCELVISKKDLFYKSYNLNSADFRACFFEDMKYFPNALKNIANFKKVVSLLIRINNYTECISLIDVKADDFRQITYNSLFNRDILHKMRISHDTLLEYGNMVIRKYDILKQIVVDKYPYILIDEYQDTNEKVIEIMSSLSSYANKIGHELFIGYFGDTAQNIYSDGVGSDLQLVHPKLKVVNKKYNRRSTSEIITLINKIRNDEIVQESIYSDSTGGSFKAYLGNHKQMNSFLNKYIQQWNIDKENKLHCLLLTNKTVAEFSGFINIYDCFRTTGYYSNNYDRLNTELLSNDLSKLGTVPLIFYKIVDLYVKINNKNSMLLDIFSHDMVSDINIKDLRQLVEILKRTKGSTFLEYLNSIFSLYESTNNNRIKSLIQEKFDNDVISLDSFKMSILKILYPNLEDDNIQIADENIVRMISFNWQEYLNWYDYINDNSSDVVVYHTYHGTKGLEFLNVIVFMENSFGRDRNYFNMFFQNKDKYDSLDDKSRIKYKQIQNLLYVSCSRAISNLRILYMDDITGFKNQFEDIFGTANVFSITESIDT